MAWATRTELPLPTEPDEDFLLKAAALVLALLHVDVPEAK